MRKQVLLVAGLCLAVVFAVAPASAQTVQAQVPFNFTFAGESFNSGNYTLVSGSGQLTLKNEHGVVLAMALSTHATGTHADGFRVFFECYHEGCFLSQILDPHGDGQEAIASKTQLGLRNKEQEKRIAVLNVAIPR